jgi:signal transduction histidine kinase
MPALTNSAETDKPAARPILVVDDETGPLESLKMILMPQYEVITASNGRDGLEMFAAHRPAVVLSDIRMPLMDGVELMKEVKKTSPETPVILITGYGTVRTAQEAVRTGAFDYISKPYDVEQIRSVVAAALERSEEASRARQRLTALQQMNRDLETRIRELAEKAALGEVSAEMIHDLNNPISILSGYISLLEDSLLTDERDTTPEEEEFLSIIKEQVNRCMGLTRSFLNYARGSRGAWEVVDLNETITAIVQGLRGQLRRQEIVPRLNLSPELPPSWMQATPVQQLFCNLILNAADAMAEGGRPGWVHIRTALQPCRDVQADSGQEVVVTVADSGPGIPDDIREKIFVPFFTTKSDGKGTGLGLAICNRVVAEHGGIITVESEPGRGTEFRIVLPFRTSNPEETRVETLPAT